MSYVQSLLARDERIVRVARSHWITLIPTIVVDTALVIIIAALSTIAAARFPPYPWFGLLLVLAPVGHLLARLLRWWSAQTVVTTRRIIQVAGMLEKQVSDTLIEKLNDIVTLQSAWGRLLNYGDIQIITGSESGTDHFSRIADPVGFKKALLDQQKSHAYPDLDERQAAGSRRDESISAAIPDLIEDLAALRAKGLITKTEFEAKKRELLDRL